MNRREATRLMGSIPVLMAAGTLGAGRLAAQQGDQFPRLTAAVNALQDAVSFMEKAPDDFGGHKAAAMDACRVAIRQLRAAMAYRRRGGQ
jgi:hypothetical protein